MPYDKQTWNDDDPATPLSAARLNHMETGIEEVDTHLADVVDAHDASAISVTTVSELVTSNVQNSLANLDSQKASINGVVNLTFNQNISGIKTFLSSPNVPTPSIGTGAANKTYVDSVAATSLPDGAVTDVKVNAAAAIQQSKIANLTTDLAAKQSISQKNAANGYAGLDANVRVPVARLGSGSPTAANFLRGDGAWATPSGGGVATSSENIYVTEQAGWDPIAADNSAAMQAAIDIAKTGNRGGRIIIPTSGVKHASTLNYDHCVGITTQGQAGASGLHGDLTQQWGLLYTGSGDTAGTRAKSAVGCTWKDLRINYNSNTFTGNLIEYRGQWDVSAGGPDSTPSSDAAYGTFENCLIGGVNGGSGNSANRANLPTNAYACLALHNAISCRVIGCSFHYAENGIVGKLGAAYSNMMVVQGGGATNLIDYAIRDTGDSWLISGFTFEFDQDQGASGYYDGLGAFGPTIFDGCWFGDASPTNSLLTPNTRPWIRYRGDSLVVRGCMMASSLGSVNENPAIIVGDTGFTCQSVSILHNHFFAPTPILQLAGTTYDVAFIGNQAPGDDLIDLNGITTATITKIANGGGTSDLNGFTGHMSFDGGIASKTQAFPPIDGHFALTPPDGTIAVDTANSRLYVRIGGTWKYAALT